MMMMMIDERLIMKTDVWFLKPHSILNKMVRELQNQIKREHLVLVFTSCKEKNSDYNFLGSS